MTKNGKYSVAVCELHPSITIHPHGTVIDYGTHQQTIMPSSIMAEVVDTEGNSRLVDLCPILEDMDNDADELFLTGTYDPNNAESLKAAIDKIAEFLYTES